MKDLNFNPYRLLGVDIEAPLEVIKAAYRALMKSSNIHPDLGGANQLAQEINEAYQILSNTEKRNEFDFKKKSEKHEQVKKVIEKEYYVACLNCQSINKVSNPNHIYHSRCYKCSLDFIVKESVDKILKEKQKSKLYSSSESNTQKQQNKKKLAENLAQEFYTRRMYFRAVDEYKTLYSSNPKEAYYGFMVGKCYYNLNYYRESLKIFAGLIKSHSDYLDAFVFAGKSLIKMSQYSEAMGYFQKALKLVDQEDATAIEASIGICYYQMGLFSKAITILLPIVNKDPLVEQNAYFLALSLYRASDFRNAKKYFLMAKFHYPNNDKIIEMIDHCNERLINL